MTGIVMFVVALVLLLLGFPVAFTFGGVAVLFGVLAQGWDLFALMPFRVYSIMQNTVLMAVPLFIFMGVVLQKTELAEQLLESMGRLFGTLASNPSTPELVADVVWQAVTAPGDQLRFRAGPDATDLLDRRKAQDDVTFIGGIKALMKG